MDETLDPAGLGSGIVAPPAFAWICLLGVVWVIIVDDDDDIAAPLLEV